MSKLDQLIAYFEAFPGVGARQAKRFAFHVLTLPKETAQDLASIISAIKNEVIECTSCRRFFNQYHADNTECSICQDGARDRAKLMVVEKDNDITAIERAGVYDGLYFVLGGTAPLLQSRENNRLRSNGLKFVVEGRPELAEVILAFAINPDGENTARFVEQTLQEVEGGKRLKISHLGRGLSTGSELEYADGDTLKSALENRR